MSKEKINPKAVLGRNKRQAQFTPIPVMNEVHEGMAEGARKYGPFNWRETEIQASDYYDSSIRHLSSWYDGEDIDPDSGINHISKTIAGLFVLRDAMLNGSMMDDRPNTCNTCGEAVGHRDICPKGD